MNVAYPKGLLPPEHIIERIKEQTVSYWNGETWGSYENARVYDGVEAVRLVSRFEREEPDATFHLVYVGNR